MKLFSSAQTAVLLLSVISTQAATLVSHMGFNDPLTEGFTNPQNSGVVTTGPLLNDQGKGAWSIDSEGASFYYNYALSPTAASSANSQGWSLRMNLRLVDIPDPVDFGVYADFASPTGIYQMGFGTQPDGDPIIKLITDSTPLQFSLDSGGSGYHAYEIRYDPLAQAADLRIDGVLRLSGWRGRAAPGNIAPQSNFGSFFDPGQANWNEFTLSIVPEPSSPLLLILGCLILCLSGMRRKLSQAK